MLYQSEDEIDFNQIPLSDSQYNEYIRKIDEEYIKEEVQPQFQIQNQLQSLIYTTLQLEYNIFINEEELKFYKSLLLQKDNKIKQLKQKYDKKNSKVTTLVQGLKRTEKKIKEVLEGHKHLSEKQQSSLKNQNVYRNRRLDCQQQKNNLYKKLCDLQSVHQNYINDIYSYEEYDEEFNEITNQNARLHKQIAKLQSRRKEMNENSEISSLKGELKGNIKKLYQRIKMAEKQQAQISQEYQSKKKKLKQMQNQQLNINSQNIQISTLLNRIDKLKQECSEANYAKTELETQYRELLSEQSLLKKKMIALNQSNSGKKVTDEKSNIVHNFKIIDSEADEEYKFNLKNPSSSKHQSNSIQSQGQLDDLINRFQKIKSKSKTNI